MRSGLQRRAAVGTQPRLWTHARWSPVTKTHRAPQSTQRLVVMDTRSHGGIQPISRDSVTATAITQPFVNDIHPFQEQARRRTQSWWQSHYTSSRAHTHTHTHTHTHHHPTYYHPACRPRCRPVRVPTSLGPPTQQHPPTAQPAPESSSAGSSPQAVGEVFLVTINLPSNFSSSSWHIQLV